jgi:hypothetical protein
MPAAPIITVHIRWKTQCELHDTPVKQWVPVFYTPRQGVGGPTLYTFYNVALIE